jgi:hypothetical protein
VLKLIIIYTLETKDAFFQITSMDSACYYSIGDVGYNKIIKSPATWVLKNDTTMVLNVIYKYENVNFILNYNKDNDYWRDEDLIFLFRRQREMKYPNFYITEPK